MRAIGRMTASEVAVSYLNASDDRAQRIGCAIGGSIEAANRVRRMKRAWADRAA